MSPKAHSPVDTASRPQHRLTAPNLALLDIPNLTVYPTYSVCLLPIRRLPPCCAKVMWLLHSKSRSILVFLFQPIKTNKIITCWHPPCACHLHCTQIVRSQRKRYLTHLITLITLVSATSDSRDTSLQIPCKLTHVALH